MTMTDTGTSGRIWAAKVIELYTQGYSDAEVAAEMKITIREYHKQITDNPTFGKLVEFGRTLSLAWWEGQARKNISNKSFNTPLWVFNMKNKFGWADRTEVKTENENLNTDLDGLRTRVSSEVERFMKRHTPELTDAQRVLSDMRMANESENSDN